MRAFRIVLWASIAAILVVVGFVSFQWQLKPVNQETAFGSPFTLVDQKGNPITQKAINEKPSAIFFGFTHCPDICPTTLYEMDGWLNDVDPNGDKINAFFVTVDPERDTTEVLDLYISNVSDRVLGITGPEDQVANMLRGYKVYFKKVPLDESDPNGDYTMDHTASVFLLKQGGLFKSTISYGENAETAIEKLKNLINSS